MMKLVWTFSSFTNNARWAGLHLRGVNPPLDKDDNFGSRSESFLWLLETLYSWARNIYSFVVDPIVCNWSSNACCYSKQEINRDSPRKFTSHLGSKLFTSFWWREVEVDNTGWTYESNVSSTCTWCWQSNRPEIYQWHLSRNIGNQTNIPCSPCNVRTTLK